MRFIYITVVQSTFVVSVLMNFTVAVVCHCEGGEALAQVAQRDCGCRLPGSVHGQVGWGFEQPGLVEGVLAHGRGIGTR